MTIRPETIEDARVWAWSTPFYDRKGRQLLFRDEWEQLGRWRRLRDVLLGWDPPKGWRIPEDVRTRVEQRIAAQRADGDA